MNADEPVARLPQDQAETFAEAYLLAIGTEPSAAREVAAHLVDADLRGVASHGLFRLSRYAKQADEGGFDPSAAPRLIRTEDGGAVVDGGGGFGVPALRLATDAAIAAARGAGAAAVGVMRVGHTGRIGAFAERAADAGMLALVFGGGAAEHWPVVAPHGGAKGVIGTNPFALAAPGGAKGAVVVDFATSAAAAGKVMAAAEAGRAIPPGWCVDAQGRPTTDPKDFAAGGAVLPLAGARGGGLGMIAELIGGAALPGAMTGLNWMVVVIDLGRFVAPDDYAAEAERRLTAIRATPPAEGYEKVEIPGERGRARRAQEAELGAPLEPAIARALAEDARARGVDPAVLEQALARL